MLIPETIRTKSLKLKLESWRDIENSRKLSFKQLRDRLEQWIGKVEHFREELVYSALIICIRKFQDSITRSTGLHFLSKETDTLNSGAKELFEQLYYILARALFQPIDHPRRHRGSSPCWPWNIKTSLVVLWGVCRMFYGSPRNNDDLDLGALFSEQGIQMLG